MKRALSLAIALQLIGSSLFGQKPFSPPPPESGKKYLSCPLADAEFGADIEIQDARSKASRTVPVYFRSVAENDSSKWPSASGAGGSDSISVFVLPGRGTSQGIRLSVTVRNAGAQTAREEFLIPYHDSRHVSGDLTILVKFKMVKRAAPAS